MRVFCQNQQTTRCIPSNLRHMILLQYPTKTGAHLQTIVEPPGRQTLRHETVRSTPFSGVLLLSFVSGSVSSWRLGSSTTSAKNANSKPGSWPVNDLNFYKLLKVNY